MLFGISKNNCIQIVWNDSKKFSGWLGVLVASAGISGGIHKAVSLVHTVALPVDAQTIVLLVKLYVRLCAGYLYTVSRECP